MKPIIKACIPVYGADVRFRFYLRLRELFRKHNMKFWGGVPEGASTESIWM